MRYALKNAVVYVKSVLAAVCLALVGCFVQSNAPKQINEHPVYETPSSHPLVLKPEGQDFYFYLSKEKVAGTDYVVGVKMLIPAHDKKLWDDFYRWTAYSKDNSKWKHPLFFDVKVECYCDGKIIPVPLMGMYRDDLEKGSKTGWGKFAIQSYEHSASVKIGGVKVIPSENTVARFFPGDVSKGDAVYKVSVRPSEDMEYPNIDLEVFFEKNILGNKFYKLGKKMYQISKKTIFLAIVLTVILSLTQCDLAKVYLSQALFPAEVVPFPMGEGKTVSYTIDSWIKKPYAISLKSEYMDGAKIFENTQEKGKIPYDFSVKCYHLKNGQEVLFYKDRLSYKTDRFHLFYGSFGWTPINPHSPNSFGVSSISGGFDAAYGKHRCDFEDNSSPEIKKYLKNAGVLRTYVQVAPYELLLY